MILQEDLPTKFDKAYSLVNYGDLKVGDDIWIVKVSVLQV